MGESAQGLSLISLSFFWSAISFPDKDLIVQFLVSILKKKKKKVSRNIRKTTKNCHAPPSKNNVIFTWYQAHKGDSFYGDISFIFDFPGGSDSKASAYNPGDPGSIPGPGRSPGEGNGNPLQYSCLENPMDGAA